MRSQSSEFESNSQRSLLIRQNLIRCLRSQSYEFESNSQQRCPSYRYTYRLFEITKLRIWKQLTTMSVHNRVITKVVWDHKVTNLKATHNCFSLQALAFFCCLRSQSYEFESNSQRSSSWSQMATVVWDHKVPNLKATHTWVRTQSKKGLLFEITKLRIWKQLTTYGQFALQLLGLFEITKLRIWKQLTTEMEKILLCWSCLRSQSYGFESNSQQAVEIKVPTFCCLRSQSYEFESNSQRWCGAVGLWECCLRSQSYEFESNSQLV